MVQVMMLIVLMLRAGSEIHINSLHDNCKGNGHIRKCIRSYQMKDIYICNLPYKIPIEGQYIGGRDKQ